MGTFPGWKKFRVWFMSGIRARVRDKVWVRIKIWEGVMG